MVTAHLVDTLIFYVIFPPLIASAFAGLLGRYLGKAGASWITIVGMAISFSSASAVLWCVSQGNATSYHFTLYHWIVSGSFSFDVGFLIDHLSALMMVIVTFVSLLVHIYSIGYMRDDDGYQRFFAYMSLFTFMMLMLVSADNFAQLFFGWEGVGLVSYLLIGFWFKKETAAAGSLKAFITNRVGDFGFILALAAIADTFGTLNYAPVFAHVTQFVHSTISILPGTHASLLTVIAILLFIGAMAKSAQIPLHIWLPESMEGPTPISALIHAATMVTAGVFMVARMSPIFEHSVAALSFVLIIGATGGFFLGLLALVEDDIKRVIAFSTMSQLGYMMAANGASAYSAGIFHLMTHACFKALLFLAAGSVIVAMHHEQNMRKMGGLVKRLPVTYITFLIGALALSAIPPFAGFYSKDAIIDAVGHSTIFGSGYAYWVLLLGGFVTSLYIFRALFMSFHGTEKFDAETASHIKESPWVMLWPLILLAIPSVLLGGIAAKGMLYSGAHNFLSPSLYVIPSHNVLPELAQNFHGAWFAIIQAFATAPFWFAIAGIVVAWLCYAAKPELPLLLKVQFRSLYLILKNQFGFDRFNDVVFVRGTQLLSRVFYHVGDQKLLDDSLVDGSGRGMNALSRLMQHLQSGYIYQYALVMIVGLLALMIWLLIKYM